MGDILPVNIVVSSKAVCHNTFVFFRGSLLQVLDGVSSPSCFCSLQNATCQRCCTGYHALAFLGDYQIYQEAWKVVSYFATNEVFPLGRWSLMVLGDFSTSWKAKFSHHGHYEDFI